MIRLLISIVSVIFFGCATTKKTEERKPDILLHEDKSELFWYQVWERENGERYIKELYRGQVKEWGNKNHD